MNPEPSFDPFRADLLESVRLEASAGTGKTYNLERVVCELIGRYKIPLNRILIVTFTNKAARELRERIRAILRDMSRPDSDRTEEQRALLTEARHNYDQASIFTIHGFCQHVLQAYPFESGSPFRQEFLSDSSLVEEGVRDYLYRRFRRIKEDDLDLIRGFLKNTDSLDEAVARLVRVTMEEMESDHLVLIPGEAQLARALGEVKDFARQSGPLFSALSGLIGLNWNAEGILGVFKILKTRQKQVTADKIARAGAALAKAADLPAWLDWFFSKQEDIGGVPAELLILLTEPVLLEKSGWETLPDDLPERDVLSRVTALFEALEPFCDGGFSAKGIHRELLGYAFLRETVAGAVPLIQDKKKIRGMRDFSDLIRILHEILTAEPDGALARTLRNQYQVVLVDEFQDTDRMQWDIFHTLFGRDQEHNYFLIGDPKQSIYGFRGADLSVYFQACETVQPERRYSLGTNYRSREAVVECCNYLFERLFSLPVKGSRPVSFQPVSSSDKGALPLDGQKQVLPAMTLCEIRIPGEKELESRESLKNGWMEDIASRMENLLSGEVSLSVNGAAQPLRPGDMSVLMDTNRDCETMQGYLDARGISSVIYSDRRVLDAPEADWFGLVLKCLANPADQSALAALLISPVFQLSAATLKALEESGQLDQVRILFHQWKNRADRGGLIRVFHTLFEEENLFPEAGVRESWKNRLLRHRRGDRSCTNLLHLAELFHQEQKARILDARGLYDHFVRMKNDPRPDDQRQVRLDKDGQAVQILTHHSSKGLEYPVVFFCGGLQDGSVGSKRTDLTYYWEDKRYRDYLLSGDSRKKAALSDWEERKRLYYVSLTRASSLLYLPFFPQGDFCYLTNLYAALCGERVIEKEDDLLQERPLAEHWPLHSEVKWKKSGALRKKKAALNERISVLLQDLSREKGALFSYSFQEEADETFPLFPDSPLEGRDAPVALKGAEWQSGGGFYHRITSVESFSSLTAGAKGHPDEQAVRRDPQADADRDQGDAREILPEELSGPLGLTRGADFGNLVHYIFETMDYSWAEIPVDEWFENTLFGPSEQSIFLEEATLRFFDQNWWLQFQRDLGEMVWNVLNCPLRETTSLKNIPPENRKHEMEFLFRIPENTRIQMQEWFVPVEKGFLKGFIDLIFHWKGKLYIADWKTTVPAGRGVLSDYDTNKLGETMHSHLYDVQAMIYVQALRRYMLTLNPDFDYKKDFGGVYYFFVRAMGEDGSRGIHFSRPDEGQLDAFLKGSMSYA